MAMERAPALLPLLLLLFLLSTADPASSQISMPPSQISLAPSPTWGAESLHISLPPSPSPEIPSPPSPAPSMGSAFPPLASISWAPTPPLKSPPAPALPNHEIQAGASDAEKKVAEVNGRRDQGAKGRNDAWIAVGVITAAVLAWKGAAVYRKRRQNVRRARYGYATRADIL